MVKRTGLSRRCPRPRGLSLVPAVASVLMLACGTTFAIGTTVSLRSRAAARDRRDQAIRTLREARMAGATRWAPNALQWAERAARTAAITMRTEEERLTILADFAAATSAWSSARDAAQRAAEQALGNAREARGRAEQAIAQADEAVSRTSATSRTVHLKTDRQVVLRRAQLALMESQILYRQGEYSSAAQRAEWVVGAADQLHDEALAIASRYLDRRVIRTWHRWEDQLITLSRREHRSAILIEKADHRLTLYVSGEPVRSYEVELGHNWVSAKAYSGDAAMPEGRYHVVTKKDRGESRYHRALLINYPNDQDRRAFVRARRRGLLPSGVRIGGRIEIHGAGRRGEDWTHGCVALSNRDIDDLFNRVDVGTPVTIVGGSGQQLYQSIGYQKRNSSFTSYEP